MDNIISVFIGGILGFIFALITLASVYTANDDIALKL